MLRYERRVLRGAPTKSGLMLGLGETREEVLGVMRDLRGATSIS
jgi:lipoate synthase